MSNISSAASYVGSQAFDDLCQAFVEQATYGHQGVYPSAISAWNSQANKVAGIDGAQPGDLVYFDADQSNGGMGHTGIYTGNGQFISATSGGVKYSNLGDWLKQTGQKLLGYIPQGHSAQSLGSALNSNTQSMANPQQVISDMDARKIPWDDNLRSRMNTMLRGQSTQLAQGPTQPTYDFGQEMENFRQVWNATHQTPLASYL